MKNLKAILLSILAVAVIGGYVIYNQFFKPADNTGSSTVNSGSNTDTSSGQTNQTSQASYKDGQYTGDAADAFYGTVQVQAIITNGKITNVQFLQYPNSPGHTSEVSSRSMPVLQSEAVQAQSANVNIVSGATQTSQAFIQSLASALAKAS